MCIDHIYSSHMQAVVVENKETGEWGEESMQVDAQPLPEELRPSAEIVESPGPHDDEKPSAVTGLVPMESPEVASIPGEKPEVGDVAIIEDGPKPADGHGAAAAPASKKARRQEVMIPNPPVLSDPVDAAKDGELVGDIDAQRQLKKNLEVEAKEEAAKKKDETQQKKRKASDDAIAKAKAKLEKAMAKAKALEDKGRLAKRTKRRLEPELAEAEAGASAPVEEPKSPVASKASSVKLSPKAKQFASPNKKVVDQRKTKAVESLDLLRKLCIADLTLPPDHFDKKILVCMHIGLMCFFTMGYLQQNMDYN